MVVIEIGYRHICLPNEKAMQFIELLTEAEIYHAKYWSAEKRKERGIESEYTYHVYPNDKEYSMKIISNDLYNMAKLAGKPMEE